MQNFGRENFDDSTCIRQISSDLSTVKVLRYTVDIVKFKDLEIANRDLKKLQNNVENTVVFAI